MLTKKQTHKKQTNKQKDTVITILRSPIRGGQSNNEYQQPVTCQDGDGEWLVIDDATQLTALSAIITVAEQRPPLVTRSTATPRVAMTTTSAAEMRDAAGRRRCWQLIDRLTSARRRGFLRNSCV